MQNSVLMGQSVSLVPILTDMGLWKFVLMGNGVQYVMSFGMKLMLKCFVVNLDIHHMVL